MLYLLGYDGPLPARQKVVKFVEYGEPFRRERGSITPLILSLSCSRSPTGHGGSRRNGPELDPSGSRVLSKGQKAFLCQHGFIFFDSSPVHFIPEQPLI